MRKRLGSLEKAPIQKIEQNTTRSSFALISCCIALIVTWFGINFAVDFFNFLEENTEGSNFISYSDHIVYYIKAAVGLLSIAFILNRQ